MRLADVMQAAPGLLALGLLPGLAAATALVPRWRWWERLAMAPGLSAGIVGLGGLLLRDLGIPFRLLTVLPLLAVAAAAAILRARRAGQAGLAGRPEHRAEGVAVVAALAAGLLTAAVVASGLRDQAVPVGDDPVVHAQVAEGITRGHDVLPLVAEPPDATAIVRTHTGFEATAALVSAMGGPRASAAMLPLVLLAIVLLPLSLTALALETSGSAAVAALAPLLAVGMVFPTWPVIYGEYPLVVDSTLVVPLVLGAARLLDSRRPAEECGLLAAAMAAIFVIHGLEALTAAVIGAPLLAGRLLARPGRRRDAVLRLGLGAGAFLAGAGAAALLTRAPAIPTPHAVVGEAASRQSLHFLRSGAGGSLADVARAFADSDLAGGIGLVLLAAGVAVALRRGVLRWAIAAALILLAVLTDVATGLRLEGLWNRLFPWAVVDRLLGAQYWVTPLLLALGLTAAAGLVREVLERRRARTAAVEAAPGPAPARDRRTQAVALAVGAGLAIVFAVAGAGHDGRALAGSVRDTSRVTAADVEVMGRMAAALPAGSLVMNDGEADAGMWLGVLTPDLAYFPKSWLGAHPDDTRLVAIAHACDDRVAAARAIAGTAASGLFVGARRSISAVHVWRVDCIGALPGVRVIARAGDPGGGVAAAFAIDRAALAAALP